MEVRQLLAGVRDGPGEAEPHSCIPRIIPAQLQTIHTPRNKPKNSSTRLRFQEKPQMCSAGSGLSQGQEGSTEQGECGAGIFLLKDNAVPAVPMGNVELEFSLLSPALPRVPNKTQRRETQRGILAANNSRRRQLWGQSWEMPSEQGHQSGDCHSEDLGAQEKGGKEGPNPSGHHLDPCLGLLLSHPCHHGGFGP